METKLKWMVIKADAVNATLNTAIFVGFTVWMMHNLHKQPDRKKT